MDAPRISIQNLYYLLCYAWNHLKQGEIVDVSNVPSTELVDLFAVVLCQGVEHLARRGLEQGYIGREDDLAGVRGRIDVLRSGRRFLLAHGQAACSFDELSPDTLSNRILKSTLRLLSQVPDLHGDLKKHVKLLCQSLPDITEIPVTSHTFRRVQLHSNNRFYRFLMSVCKLIQESALIDPKSGTYQFRDFIRDERAMARVFEDFLFNFIRLEIPAWEVKREHIAWKAVSVTDPNLIFLPRMKTDISLRRGSERKIIDAKYYQRTMVEYMGGEKVHSGNLYQLMSYLTNSIRREGEKLSGMLIYPQVDKVVNEVYQIQGFDVAVCTINLDQPWQGVRSDLVRLLD